MKTTMIDGFANPVIVTYGGVDGATGREIFGVFATEQDARSEDSEELALAIIGSSQLTEDQIADAEANSEELV